MKSSKINTVVDNQAGVGSPNGSSEGGPGGRARLRLWALFVLSGLVLAGLLLASGRGYSDNRGQEAEAQPVEVTRVEMQDAYQEPAVSIGLVESPQMAQIGFELAGQVVRLLVDEGELVEQGQVLAILNTARLDAQIQELSASRERARADQQLARLTVQRIAPLAERNVESSQKLDEANAQLDAASAQVAEMDAAIRRIEVELEKSSLIAPFSGQIVDRFLDEGTVISAGAPVFALTDNRRLQARFAMPDNALEQLEVGTGLEVSFRQQSLVGTVHSVLPNRNRQTRTVDVMVDLPLARATLMPGDLVSTTIQHTRHENGAWLPISALSNGLRGLWNVFVLSDQDDNTLEARSVEIVFSDGQRAYVRGALKQDEWVVANGSHRLAPGQLVAVNRVSGVPMRSAQ